jgi:hypothetical protein
MVSRRIASLPGHSFRARAETGIGASDIADPRLLGEPAAPYRGWYPASAPILSAAQAITGTILGTVTVDHHPYLAVRDRDGQFRRYPYYGPYRSYYDAHDRPTSRPYTGTFAGTAVRAPVAQGDPHWDAPRYTMQHLSQTIRPSALRPTPWSAPHRRATPAPGRPVQSSGLRSSRNRSSGRTSRAGRLSAAPGRVRPDRNSASRGRGRTAVGDDDASVAVNADSSIRYGRGPAKRLRPRPCSFGSIHRSLTTCPVSLSLRDGCVTAAGMLRAPGNPARRAVRPSRPSETSDADDM